MSSPQTTPQPISDVIRQLMAIAANEDSISIGHILNIFGVRGFALLLLVLSLLNIVIFMVPFSSIVFGLPMVVLAAQIALGLHAPIFPRVLRRQMIQREALMAGLERIVIGLQRIEHYIKPRFMFLTHPHLDRVHGVVVLIMAAMVTMPIPVLNVPPSFGIAFLAIGVLQRDGLFITLGYGVGFWCLVLFKSLGHYAHLLTGGG